jgi:hypothetical protein
VEIFTDRVNERVIVGLGGGTMKRRSKVQLIRRQMQDEHPHLFKVFN